MASNHHSRYLRAPTSTYAEALRTLRTALLRKVKKGRQQIIAFTSCWPQEGTTETCLGLSIALAEVGNRVLLVDCDLRNQSLSRRLNLCAPSPSQTRILQPSPQPSQLHPNLLIAPAGNMDGDHDPDLLEKKTFQDWLQQQRSSFDFILIDTPPLSVFKDVLSLGQVADGAVLVSSQQYFRGIPEGEMSEDLRDAGLEMLGFVSICPQPRDKGDSTPVSNNM